MNSPLHMPANPVELAINMAEKAVTADFEPTTQEEFDLYSMEHVARMLGFLGSRYFMSAARGIVIPHEAVEERVKGPVRYHDICDVVAEGEVVSYARVHVGSFVGRGSVRTLCLAVDEATVVNTMTQVDSDHMLFVPVLAVNDISRTS